MLAAIYTLKMKFYVEVHISNPIFGEPLAPWSPKWVGWTVCPEATCLQRKISTFAWWNLWRHFYGCHP